MDIALAGSVSKKVLVYPLLKLFMQLGDACFVTYDTTYRRLIDGNDIGEFQNIKVIITDDTSDEAFAKVGHTIEDFNNILYEVDNYVPDMPTCFYMCTSTTYTDEEINFADNIEVPVHFLGMKYKGLNLRGQDVPTNNKKGLFGKKLDVMHRDIVVPIKVLPISLESICYCEIVESEKIFPPVRDPAVLEIIATDFCNELKMTKAEVKKLLQKEWK